MRKAVIRSIWYCIGFAIFLNGQLLAIQFNKLQRLFHHHGSKNEGSIELGKIVFYFSSSPKVTEVRSAKSNEKIFFIADLFIDKSVKQQIDRFNSLSGNNYTARVEPEAEGLRLILTYDPKKIDLTWGTFTAIKSEVALEFRLLDKNYLSLLNNKPDQILKFVSNSKKPRVVIDCGHGGDDCGAIGFNSLMEKEIALDVGLSLAELLRSSGGEVFLTRESDCTVFLDDRTSYANAMQADLLVSIHANAALNKAASGFEIFCLSDNYYAVADQLLACNKNNIKKVDTIYAARNKRSDQLAHAIESDMLAVMKGQSISIVNRSVKKAAAQILVGTCMPSVLVEVGFVTNEKEAKLLHTKEYRDLLAHGISQGISHYFAHTA